VNHLELKAILAHIGSLLVAVYRFNFRLKISNAILEGLNSLVKAAAARARGFRTIRNYTTIIYLITGKLNFAAINPALPKEPCFWSKIHPEENNSCQENSSFRYSFPLRLLLSVDFFLVLIRRSISDSRSVW